MNRTRGSLLVALILFGQLIGLPAQTRAQSWLGFRSALGHEWLGGHFAAPSGPFRGDTRAEWSVVLLAPLPWWGLQVGVGGGLSRVTYDLAYHWQIQSYPVASHTALHKELDPPIYERWNHVRFHGLVEVERPIGAWLDAYVGYRYVRGRLRSQTQLYWAPTDQPRHSTPYDRWRTTSHELAIGVRSDLAGRLPFELDLMYRAGRIRPRGAIDFDLRAHNLARWSGGFARGLQIGVSWQP